MLLTHPDREVHWDQLHVNCAGDEFAPSVGGAFSDAPLYFFGEGRVKFGAYPLGNVSEDCGSVTAFLPSR